ncbi:MAG: hypothetical protein JWQ57_1308 [Mucilaginibacter sp.]|nr:hypothetical protein [Mucilaginibacter sp.]
MGRNKTSSSLCIAVLLIEEDPSLSLRMKRLIGSMSFHLHSLPDFQTQPDNEFSIGKQIYLKVFGKTFYLISFELICYQNPVV